MYYDANTRRFLIQNSILSVDGYVSVGIFIIQPNRLDTCPDIVGFDACIVISIPETARAIIVRISR